MISKQEAIEKLKSHDNMRFQNALATIEHALDNYIGSSISVHIYEQLSDTTAAELAIQIRAKGWTVAYSHERGSQYGESYDYWDFRIS